MLIGNVGQEPEVRYVDQGVAVARIRLATERNPGARPYGLAQCDTLAKAGRDC